VLNFRSLQRYVART